MSTHCSAWVGELKWTGTGHFQSGNYNTKCSTLEMTNSEKAGDFDTLARCNTES